MSHEDWLPTFAAAGGTDIKEKLLKGVMLNDRPYKNHIDGHNLLGYLSGQVKDSPRKSFIYTNDAGEVVAIHVGDWKAAYLENRARQLDDPFEKAQYNSNTYHDWMIDRGFVLVPLQAVASVCDYPTIGVATTISIASLSNNRAHHVYVVHASFWICVTAS